MTAKTFYGASWQTLDRARRQVLQTVREGRGSPRRPGAVLYTTSRIKSPASACRKLRQRGLAPTAQAALAHLRDTVGVRVICAFQDDVYQMARWLEERPAFAVLQTKDYISHPKENGYRSYHLILGILDGPGKHHRHRLLGQPGAPDQVQAPGPPRGPGAGGTQTLCRRDRLGGPVHGDHPGTAGRGIRKTAAKAAVFLCPVWNVTPPAPPARTGSRWRRSRPPAAAGGWRRWRLPGGGARKSPGRR